MSNNRMVRYGLATALGLAFAVCAYYLGKTKSAEELPAQSGAAPSDNRSTEEAGNGAQLTLPDRPIARAAAQDVAVIVRAIDPNNSPIAGVAITIASEAALIDLGSTSQEGILIGQVSISPAFWVIGKCSGYETAYRAISTVDEIRGSEVVLQMGQESTISGLVQLPISGLAPEGTAVLAWPEWFAPSSAWIESGKQHAGPLSARTAPNGGFTLHGLSAGTSYLVSAVHGNMISRRPQRVRAPASNVVLQLLHVYALDAQVIESGQSVYASPYLFEYEGSSWVCKDTDAADRIQADNPVIIGLLGLDSAQIVSGCAGRFCLLYLSSIYKQQLGPVEFDLRIPGYEQTSSTAYAVPLSNGWPSITPISINRSVTCWGKLRIVITTPDNGNCVLPLGEVRLIRKADRHTYCCAAGSGRFESLIDGVPCGTYSAYLSLRDAVTVQAASKADVVISEGVESRLDFDLTNTGTLAIRVLLQAGDEYRGILTAHVLKDESVSIPVQFRSAPYRLDCMAAGVYDLRLGDAAIPRGTAVVTPVQVKPGEAIEMVVRLSN